MFTGLATLFILALPLVVYLNVSLLVKKRPSHNVRIGSAHNINVVDKLNEVLDDEGIRMFRSTCFGSFLDLPNCNFQGSIARNIIPSPQELNHFDLPNPLMFGSTDDDANIAQAVDEFDDFSTPPSADLLKKMRLDASQSSHPPAKKQKIVEESEKMRDADKTSTASEEKISLSKSNLDEIKSYVSTYIDMKFNDLQKLMADQYTRLLGVVKEGFALFGKETESLYTDKLKEDGRHSTDAEVDEAINKERVMGNIDSQCYISDNDIAAISQVPVCKTNLTYVRKNPSRRNRQPSKVCQSPFVSVFDSGSKEKEVIQSNKKLKYSFEGHDINGPYAEDLFSKFTVWMSSELYKPHATKKGKDEDYTAIFADLKPSLDFVVAQPVKKSWFYYMEHSSNCWNDEHIDVVFYYLRKKEKLATTSAYRYTTVKCVFMNYIHHTYTHYHRSHSEIDLSLHDAFVRSMKVASVERSICEIMQGLCIPAAIPCHFIDKKKDRTDWSLLDAYKEKTDQHAFAVHIVDEIVQQSSCSLDCGLFVAAYAEFLSARHQIPSSKFDPKKHRTRYASLLWDYGVNKTYSGYVSDSQDPPRPRRTFIPSEDTEMIDAEP
ncbi:hypothetical protein T459_14700 [Capsicum annuum]|uniref:Ubiquitin-like protease family profile domain-containing protein n=1 Tax=Capsicum annuum TaxID=4072 RepID=A0A2G2ZIC7_CAPAN|nr:hypothetical protein FXO37_19500 [Capsicum annuum]PHT81685.1 hypothetical protein T459_14700 [Capsicum annuum]